MRYARLYLHMLRFSFSEFLQWKLDYFFRVFMDVVFYAVQLGFFGILYRHTTMIAGWNYDQILVFVSGFFVVDALWMSLFSNNMWWFPFLINRGDLDYYLTRPVSTLFFVSLRLFAANSCMNLLMAVGIWIWALGRYPGEVTAAQVALYCLLMVNGAFLQYVMNMLFLIPAFWMQSERAMGNTFFVFMEFSSRPHGIYPYALRMILTLFLPLAMVASIPADVFFNGLTPATLLTIVGVTAFSFSMMVGLWKLGLRSYASASS